MNHKKRKIGVSLITLTMGIFGLGSFMCNRVILPKKSSLEESLKFELDNHTITEEQLERMEKRPFSIVNSRGEMLVGEWLLCGSITQKVIILCHGFGCNRATSYKYARLFLKRGYDVLVYDHVHSGMSEGKYTTMGWKESRDLKLIVDNIFEKYGEDSKIATMGESMGAATVLLHMAVDKRLEFVIADCPYASLWEQLKYRLKVEYHLPSFPLLWAASFACWIRAGFRYSEIAPWKALRDSDIAEHIPLLLIHGQSDTYIPCSASERLAQVKKGRVELYLCPGAEHARSFITNPLHYEQVIDQFLKNQAEIHF